MQKEKPSTKSSPPATEARPKRKRLRKVLVIGGVGILTLGLGYLAWRQFSPKPMETDEPGADASDKPHNLPQPPAVHTSTTDAGQPGGYRPDTAFPLTIYTKGEKVKNIQKALNYKFKSGLTVDGEWGPKTEAALKANGQPTVINQAQYDFLLAAMKKLGLAGQRDGNIGRIALTRRPCTAVTQDGRCARLDAGWLAGPVIAEGGGRSQVVTDGGNLLAFDTTDLIFA